MKLRQTLFYRSFLKDVDLLVHHFGCLTAFSRITISTIKEKRTEILKIARKRPDTCDLQTGLGYFSPIKTVIRNCIKVAPSILQSGQLQIIQEIVVNYLQITVIIIIGQHDNYCHNEKTA